MVFVRYERFVNMKFGDLDDIHHGILLGIGCVQNHLLQIHKLSEPVSCMRIGVWIVGVVSGPIYSIFNQFVFLEEEIPVAAKPTRVSVSKYVFPRVRHVFQGNETQFDLLTQE